MIATMFTIIMHLATVVRYIHDNISPERRRRRKREQLRRYFYNGSLLVRTRGGKGVVNLSSSNDNTLPSAVPSDQQSLSRRFDTISTTSVGVFIGLWLVGLPSPDITTIVSILVGGWLVFDKWTVASRCRSKDEK